MTRARLLPLVVVATILTWGAGMIATAAGPAEPIVVGVQCCAPAERLAPPDPPPPASNPIFVIGDSLFVGVVSPLVLGRANTIQARLEATGRTVFTSAESGRRIPAAIDVVRRRSAEIAVAEAVLIGLGTNDLFGSGGNSVTDARRQIDSMIQAVRAINPDVRVVWVDVSVERSATRTARWNAALDDAATETASVEVCKWRDVALANPAWFAGDDIHLTGTGYRARRDILIDCLLTTSNP